MRGHGLIDENLLLLDGMAVDVANHIERRMPHILDDVFFGYAHRQPDGGVIVPEVMEAARNARISGAWSISLDRTVVTMETSLRMSLGNIGRSGRSIIRAVRVACSVGRDSLLRKEPGILPTEYIFSS